MAQKRYYWLKLPEDFFRRSDIRRLRRLPEGDRLTLIYLEMLLAGMKTGGALDYGGEEDPAEELALELYEDPEEVRTVLEYLTQHGLGKPESAFRYVLTDCGQMTGAETADAGRMREMRRRNKNSSAPETPPEEPPPAPAASPPAGEEYLSRLFRK